MFLLSRIREEYVATGDAHGSVVTAIAATARVITSAALIMVACSSASCSPPTRCSRWSGSPSPWPSTPPSSGRAGARADEPARRPRLVAAALAGPHPAKRQPGSHHTRPDQRADHARPGRASSPTGTGTSAPP